MYVCQNVDKKTVRIRFTEDLNLNFQRFSKLKYILLVSNFSLFRGVIQLMI